MFNVFIFKSFLSHGKRAQKYHFKVKHACKQRFYLSVFNLFSEFELY